jgi:hypothetical protein
MEMFDTACQQGLEIAVEQGGRAVDGDPFLQGTVEFSGKSGDILIA